jgi:hypothetical protein
VKRPLKKLRLVSKKTVPARYRVKSIELRQLHLAPLGKTVGILSQLTGSGEVIAAYQASLTEV